MVADLTRDEDARVGLERDASERLEAADRLEQADHPLLHEVLDLVAGARVATGDPADEAEMPCHELLERDRVVALAHGGDEPGVPLSAAVRPGPVGPALGGPGPPACAGGPSRW